MLTRHENSLCIIGCTSAIQASLIAFGLHDNSGKTLILIPGYLISPLTGYPIKIIHELRRFLRLFLLNINYLQCQNIIKTVQKNIMDFEHPTFQGVQACIIGCKTMQNILPILNTLPSRFHSTRISQVVYWEGASFPLGESRLAL